MYYCYDDIIRCTRMLLSESNHSEDQFCSSPAGWKTIISPGIKSLMHAVVVVGIFLECNLFIYDYRYIKLSITFSKETCDCVDIEIPRGEFCGQFWYTKLGALTKLKSHIRKSVVDTMSKLIVHSTSLITMK